MVQEIVRKGERGKEETVRTRIMIGGKEVRLRFTMAMWVEMEEKLCVMDDLYTVLHSKGRFKTDKLPWLVSLMSGGEIKAADVAAEADPATMRALLEEVQRVIRDAMTMKEKKYDDDSIHDEVMEEIERKKQGAD